MKEYKLTDTITGKLNKVTPKNLKKLKTLELIEPEIASKKIMDLFVNGEGLKDFIDAIFTLSGEIEDVEDIDVAVVLDGYKGFFEQLNPLTTK